MPTLNLRVEAKDQHGRPIPAPAGLAQAGLLVPATVSDAYRQTLVEPANPALEAVKGTAAIRREGGDAS